MKFCFSQIEQEQHLREEKINVLTLLQMSELRAPLFISLVLQVAQQFSGINAVSTVTKIMNSYF